MGNIFTKGLDRDDEKRLFKRFKNIGDKNEKQLEIKDRNNSVNLKTSIQTPNHARQSVILIN